MEKLSHDQELSRLRVELRPYLLRNNLLAVGMFTFDFAGVVALALLAVAVGPIWLKILLSVTSGAMIAALFVLGHDAIHGSLTSSRRLNTLFGRAAFLPSLHNASLWLIQHNRL